MFPNFKGNETTEEKVNQIQNYLYMLVEQLRYSMANVGKENFNAAEFDNIVNLITEPVYIQLSDSEKQTESYIQSTAESFNLRIEGLNTALSGAISDAKTELEGQISEVSNSVAETDKTIASLTVNLSEIGGHIETLSGKYADLQLTVDAFNTTVGEINSNYSTVTQRVNEIDSVVSGYDDNFTRINQRVDSINIEVTNLGDSSVITLSKDGVQVTSKTIEFVGVVKFEDLAGVNTTIINGSNIKTGTIQGVTFMSEDTKGSGNSGFFVTTNGYRNKVGGIRHAFVDGDGLYADKMYLYTQTYFDGYSTWRPSVKIESVGNISVEAPDGLIYMKAGQYVTMSCGNELTIYIDTISSTTTWQFIGDALYKNGVAVL